jgi:hypothetical protein
VSDNWDYNVTFALRVVLEYGLIDLFFHVAIARQRVDVSLHEMVLHGCPGLPKSAQNLLYTKGYASMVCNYQKGVVLKCMEPNDQVRVSLYQMRSRS